jgi:hypothetical protein
MTTLRVMRFGVVAAAVGLLLLPTTSAYAEDTQLVAVVSATPALMTVATSGGRYTVTVDEGPRPEAEWFVTASSDGEPPVLLLSDKSNSDRASAQASGDLVLTLVH